MRDGTASTAAMDLLIRSGDARACDRLCDVRNVAGTRHREKLSPPRWPCPARRGQRRGSGGAAHCPGAVWAA
jgi:hypothetical protein